MKKEILTLIIGILIGAVLATVVLLLIQNNSKSNVPSFDKGNFQNMEKPSDLPEDFDESNMPEGFDPSKFGGRGERTTTESNS